VSSSQLTKKKHCFSKDYRLTSSNEYSEIFKKSRRFNAPNLAFLVKPNTLGHARLGLAVSKGQIPSAVHRNRIKRIARESFRIKRVLMPSIDVVVVAYKGLLSLSRVELQQSLNRQWEKLIEQHPQA
jgi:ribonuclease P protein component